MSPQAAIPAMPMVPLGQWGPLGCLQSWHDCSMSWGTVAQAAPGIPGKPGPAGRAGSRAGRNLDPGDGRLPPPSSFSFCACRLCATLMLASTWQAQTGDILTAGAGHRAGGTRASPACCQHLPAPQAGAHLGEGCHLPGALAYHQQHVLLSTQHVGGVDGGWPCLPKVMGDDGVEAGGEVLQAGGLGICSRSATSSSSSASKPLAICCLLSFPSSIFFTSGWGYRRGRG